MLKCPECNKEMMWSGDNEIDEEVYITTMICNECDIEVNKFWGDGIDKEGR
jgi:transcription elongation factor Elf1